MTTSTRTSARTSGRSTFASPDFPLELTAPAISTSRQSTDLLHLLCLLSQGEGHHQPSPGRGPTSTGASVARGDAGPHGRSSATISRRRQRKHPQVSLHSSTGSRLVIGGHRLVSTCVGVSLTDPSWWPTRSRRPTEVARRKPTRNNEDEDMQKAIRESLSADDDGSRKRREKE